MSTNPLMTVATRAARSASRVLLRGFEKLEDSQLTTQRRTTICHRLAQKVNQDLTQSIRSLYPEHAINGIASDSHNTDSTPEHNWIITPIDGMQNLMTGTPHLGISLCYQLNGKTTLAMIHNPFNDESFSAVAGEGALLNQKRIRVTKQLKQLNQALIGTCDISSPISQDNSAAPLFQVAQTQSLMLRASGSVGLDLAYLACGRIHAFCGTPTDHSNALEAPLLIAKEAGAIVSHFEGKQITPTGTGILCADLHLHPQLITACLGKPVRKSVS